ncbi:MAG: FG-GAP-like repeat-containing protein [Bacteroidota bacterium]
MKRLATALLLLFVGVSIADAQYALIGETNAYKIKNRPGVPDSLRPWLSDQGVRRVWVGNDLDKDGKQELIATDYSSGGKVHVFEMTGDTLELVWSSPPRMGTASGSTPRHPRTGDLDGDGNGEIIFALMAGTADYQLQVWEYSGTDNSYGDPVTGGPSLVLEANQFASLGIGNFRMNRECMHVQDFDGDGRDELIMANRDVKTYVLGVVGEFPGFGTFQVEGGDPAVHPENAFTTSSWWHSIGADIDGDGKDEIVNQYWDYWRFWSIDVLGPDSYRYPAPVAEGKTNHTAQYNLAAGHDATSYMGIYPADVDGDGKDEVVGILFIGNDPVTDDGFAVAMVSLTTADTGVYVWKGDSTQFGLIGVRMWENAGKTLGSHWGIATYDFDGDGKTEIYIGGSADYNVTRMTYKGSGSLLQESSYQQDIVFPGDQARYHEIDYYDSLGLSRDTVYKESPFLSGIHAGGDLNGNGRKELAIAYQSIADSITYTFFHWDTTGPTRIWKQDSVRKALNTSVINVRVLEYQGTTGFREVPYRTVTPDDYVLEQNYPNPFNPGTTIRFNLPVNKKISLVVYDINGKVVRTLIDNQEMDTGPHTAAWDGKNSAGQPVASGTYIYTLKFGNFSKSQKMILLK